MFKNIILAGLGGGVGTMMRFCVYTFFKNEYFPGSTLLINIAGCLAIGLVFGFALKDIRFENNWRIFLATGVCGGFTTFSAFSLENFKMLQDGKYLLTATYVLLSTAGGIAATWAGYRISAN